MPPLPVSTTDIKRVYSRFMGADNKHLYSFPKSHMLSCVLGVHVSLWLHRVNWFEEVYTCVHACVYVRMRMYVCVCMCVYTSVRVHM